MRFVPKLEEPDARERFLTPDERSRLLEALQDYSQLRDIVLLGIFTGWRKGQILGLRKSAMDSTNQSVTIIKSKGTRARKVPVSSVVWEILTKLSNDTEDFLFINHLTGQPLLNFDKTWRTALTKAKIEGLHFHDLRRTFAVEMLNIKADSLEIQSALGHSDIRTTKIYAQVQNQPLRDSLDRMTDGFKIHDFAIVQPSAEIAH
jgi:integrase